VRLKLAILSTAILVAALAVDIAAAQTMHVTYVCNGERVFIESCNIRDLSDTATCMVGHPDHIQPNGLMKYTNETRGALKALFPTCKQPSAQEIAHAQAFEKKQNDLYEANKKKAEDENDAIEARARQIGPAKKPMTADERAINRCITSGRLPASCTGNMLLAAFSKMLTSVLPDVDKGSASAGAGMNMAGVFQGPGDWRLDFTDAGVLVDCTGLSPDERHYTLDFKNNRTTLIVDVTPKPLVLTIKNDGTIVGPGPVTINGVVASGYSAGSSSSFSGYRDQNGNAISDAQAANSTTPVLDSHGNSVSGAAVATPSGHTVFARKTVTCPALNLSSKGASVGMQTMQTDLLKNMFGGDKGAPTPPGIRMHGIFAAPTGFSVQFFPESAILGCGPDAARAYPYTVASDGSRPAIKVLVPDHPLTFVYKTDGTLEPSETGPYQVHGRTIAGQNDDGDFTFAPMETSCNLAALAPTTAIPSSGGAAALSTASGAAAGTTAGTTAGAAAGHAPLPTSNISTLQAPTGNAVLTISSGFPAQPGVMNPLAGHPFLILRDDYDAALTKAGVAIPAGMTGPKAVASLCTTRTPECQKALSAISSAVASSSRADVTGKSTMPGVPPGTYYLLISAQFNKQNLIWGFRVDLKSGPNSITLDQRNAKVLN
jgi:hypothetical protein